MWNIRIQYNIWTLEASYIMALYSYKIIGWVLSKRLDLCSNPHGKNCKIIIYLTIHTDRGCPYISNVFSKATEDMVRHIHEIMYALLKRKWLNRFKIMNYRHAYNLVFQYIETFYNTMRDEYFLPNQYHYEYF